MSNTYKKEFKIRNMSCVGCEKTIEKALNKTPDIINIKADYKKSTVFIESNSIINEAKIKNTLKEHGYYLVENNNNSKTNILSILIIVLGLYVIGNQIGIFNIFQKFPIAKDNITYGALFLIGLMTSLHCIAMCGGINLTQSMRSSKEKILIPNLIYNLGRVISYSLIGGIMGSIGGLFSISLTFRSLMGILVGVAMIIMSFNMLNLFPKLKKFTIRPPRVFNKLFLNKKVINSSLLLGLINGFMPCGPLQSMQLYSLSAGNFLKGFLSMFFFSIGTVPLMFLFGFISSFLKKKYQHIMLSFSAILIFIIGIGMIQNNLVLNGISFNSLEISESNIIKSEVIDSKQIIITNLESGKYDTLKVKNGIPVKWTIIADKANLNGCNNEIIIPEYNISFKLTPGENILEFTPTKLGEINYSCWMGMIKSKIIVY